MTLLRACTCGHLHPHNKPCPQRDKQKNQRPNAVGVYNTTRWRKLRATILDLERDCAHCGQPATTVDHITPFTDAGDPLAWDPWNLQPLCTRCHGRKDGARKR